MFYEFNSVFRETFTQDRGKKKISTEYKAHCPSSFYIPPHSIFCSILYYKSQAEKTEQWCEGVIYSCCVSMLAEEEDDVMAYNA